MASNPGGRDQNYFGILGAEASRKRKIPDLNNSHNFPNLNKNNKLPHFPSPPAQNVS